MLTISSALYAAIHRHGAAFPVLLPPQKLPPAFQQLAINLFLSFHPSITTAVLNPQTQTFPTAEKSCSTDSLRCSCSHQGRPFVVALAGASGSSTLVHFLQILLPDETHTCVSRSELWHYFGKGIYLAFLWECSLYHNTVRLDDAPADHKVLWCFAPLLWGLASD